MNWLIKMYRSLYLLSVPADKTVIRSSYSGLLSRGEESLPPQQQPQPSPDDYQEPDDDMDALRKPDWFDLYEYRDVETEERKSTSGVNLDRVQNYYAERDREIEMGREREMDAAWEMYYEGGFADFNYGP